SVCNVALSWIWERSPISIHSLSPRRTAPHHTLASDLRRTRPTTTAVSAIQYSPSAGNSGCSPASSNIGIVALLQTDTCHVARAWARGEEVGRYRRQVNERQPHGLPPPCGGGLGWGGRAVGRSRCHLARPPTPDPSPTRGRGGVRGDVEP